MKRLLPLLLAMLLLQPLLPARAAARGKLSFAGVPGEVKRGGSFTLTLQCGRNPGVQEMRLTLSFDKRVLAVENVEDLGLFPGGKIEKTEEKAVLSFRAPGKNSTFDKTGNVAKITLSVREDAPYGPFRVGLTWNDRILDIHDANGKIVPFDVQDAGFRLLCPHENTARTVIAEASVAAQGVVQVTCADCGETWQEVFSYTVAGDDGATAAALSPGAFPDGSEPAVHTEYIFGGEESDLAREMFGSRLVRAFRIRFTVGGAAALPKEDVDVTLTVDTELPDFVALYAYLGGSLERIGVERAGNTLSFPYRAALFLLVNTPPEEEPPVSSEDPLPASSAVPVTTLSPEEEKRRRDGVVLGVSAAVLVVSGAGVVLLLRRTGRRY